MNRNHLKLIACAAMLLDHMGLLLFPDVLALRMIGRVAMPLFAFFIGEGCRYTKNRKKYFLSVFLLGVGCQLIYIVDALIETGGAAITSDAWYLNILLCFSVAIPGGYLLRDVSAADRKNAPVPVGKFVCLLLWAAALTAGGVLLPLAREHFGWGLEFDYGVWAILLCVAGVPFETREMKLLAFSAVLLLYCAVSYRAYPIVWCALLSLPLLFLYNGQSGSKRFKYAFYIFYPAHLGVLYLVSLLF